MHIFRAKVTFKKQTAVTTALMALDFLFVLARHDKTISPSFVTRFKYLIQFCLIYLQIFDIVLWVVSMGRHFPARFFQAIPE